MSPAKRLRRDSRAAESLLAAAGTIVVLAMCLAADGRAAQAPLRLDVQGYYALAGAYLNGNADRAVAELQHWPVSSLDEIKSMMERSSNLDVLRAAAMLETEAAFASGVLDVLRARLGNARSWLGQYRRLLLRAQRLAREPTRDDFTPRWYVTVARRSLSLSIATSDLLEDARDEFPDDASIHLVYGLLRETNAIIDAGTPVLKAIASGRSTARITPAEWRTAELSAARAAFQRALMLNPRLVEAQLRLAHVYLGLKDERRAVPLLEEVLANPAPPPYEYVAAILLGDVRARSGQLQPAVDLYVRARTLIPGAQAAFLAHAQALRAAGNVDGAGAVIGEMIARAQHVDDPWMRYPRGFETDATDLMPLRAMARNK